jgi:hypothetical protein
MYIRQYWRLVVALFPAMLIGTVVFDYLRKLGWDQLGARAAQFAAAFAFGIAILWVSEKLLPSKRIDR